MELPISHEHTVDMIERDILDAQAVLNRHDAAPVDRLSGSSASRDQQQIPAAGGRPVSISDARRRQILSQLANERAERRGYASDREIHLAETEGLGMAERKGVTRSTASSESTAAGAPRDPAAIQQALQDAASAAVASALDKALASLGRAAGSGPVSSTGSGQGRGLSASPTRRAEPAMAAAGAGEGWTGAGEGPTVASAAAPQHERVVTTAMQLGLESPGSRVRALDRPLAGLASATVGSPGRGLVSPPTVTSYSIGGAAAGGSAGGLSSQSKSEREDLIAKLLAERRAKLRSEGGPYSSGSAAGPGAGPGPASGSAAGVSLPTMPAVPPLVAALQAQAKQAAETAARAAEAAAKAVLQQQLTEQRIAEQRRQLAEVTGSPARPGVSSATAAFGSPQRVDEGVQVSGPVDADVGSRSPARQSPRRTTTTVPNLAASVVEGTAPSPDQGMRAGPAGRAKSANRGRGASKERGTSATGGSASARGGPAVSKGPFKRPTKEDIAREREKKLYGECTFQPTISAGSETAPARPEVVQTRPGGSVPGSPPRLTTDRLAHLAQDKVSRWQELEKKRSEEEEARLRSDCTFQPNSTYDDDRGRVVDRHGKQYVSVPARQAGRAGSADRSRSRSPALADNWSRQDGWIGHEFHMAHESHMAHEQRTTAAALGPVAPAPPPAPAGHHTTAATGHGVGVSAGPSSRAGPVSHAAPRSHASPAGVVASATSAPQAQAVPGHGAQHHHYAVAPASAPVPPPQPIRRAVSPPPVESPLAWEKSRARQYVDGREGAGPLPGRVVQQPAAAAALQSQAAPVRTPAVPPPVPVAAASAVSGPATASRTAGAIVGQAHPTPAVQQTVQRQYQPASIAAAPPAPVYTAAAPGAPSGAGSPSDNTPPVVARLYAEADRRALARAKAKATIEQQQIAQYSFRPSLNPVSLALVQRQEADIAAGQPAPPDKQRHKPLHERSAALARAHEQYLHQLRLEAAMANRDVTFKPRINPVSAVLANKKAAQLGLPVGEDVSGEASGAGSVTPTSPAPKADTPTGAGSGGKTGSGGTAAKAKTLPPSVAATKRLMAEAAAAEARRKAAREQAMRAQAQLHPFTPAILPKSEKLLERKLKSLGLEDDAAAALAEGSGGVDGFLLRQQVLSMDAAKKKAEVEAQVRAAEGLTFKPDTGNAEEILAIARPTQVMETAEERYQRLAKDDAEAVAQARKTREEAYYGQFSYAPAINPSSRARGRSKTTEERFRNDAGARERLRQAALAEAKFRAEHPFQPTLVAKGSQAGARGRRGSKDSAGMAGPGSEYGAGGSVMGEGGDGPLRLAVVSDPEHVSARIQAHEKAKAERLEAARKLAEYEAMQDCTFAPDTAASKKSHAKLTEAVAVDGGVVVVRGLGRHLELRELSRKLEEDKKEREVGAFSVKGVPQYEHLPPGMPRPPTVPQPFHLSTAETAPLIAARHADRENRAAGAGVGAGRRPSVERASGSKPSTRAMLQGLLDGDTMIFTSVGQADGHDGEGGHSTSAQAQSGQHAPASRLRQPTAGRYSLAADIARRSAAGSHGVSGHGDVGLETTVPGINITRM